jgi:hypothetical protein
MQDKPGISCAIQESAGWDLPRICRVLTGFAGYGFEVLRRRMGGTVPGGTEEARDWIALGI